MMSNFEREEVFLEFCKSRGISEESSVDYIKVLDAWSCAWGIIKERLIVAESERDELKSKLSQFEREIPKTPEGFPELDKDHLIKICIHQQSKLAEIDVASNHSRFLNHLDKAKQEVHLWPAWKKHYSGSQPIANNSEPVTPNKAEAPVGFIKTVGGYPDDSKHELILTVPFKSIKDGDKLYLHPQVTPNKAEVPAWKPISQLPLDNPKKVVMVIADYTDEPKSIEFHTVANLNGFEQYTYWAEPLALPKEVNEWCNCNDCIYIANHFKPLPPLKGDEINRINARSVAACDFCGRIFYFSELNQGRFQA